MRIKTYEHLKKHFPDINEPDHHFNKYPNHPWLKSKPLIQDFIIKYFLNIDLEFTDIDFQNGTIVIHEDLTVDFSNDVHSLRNNKTQTLTNIPFQIKNCHSLIFNETDLKSAIGTPYNAWNVDLGNNKIESFEGISESIIRFLHLNNNNIKNFDEAPSFKSEQLTLNVSNNPIFSWDGFTKCNELYWWQKEWCEETSYDLLMKTPKNINIIWNDVNFISNKIVKEDECLINMRWLRDSQKSNYINNNLNCSFKNEEKNKKRKI